MKYIQQYTSSSAAGVKKRHPKLIRQVGYPRSAAREKEYGVFIITEDACSPQSILTHWFTVLCSVVYHAPLPPFSPLPPHFLPSSPASPIDAWWSQMKGTTPHDWQWPSNVGCIWAPLRAAGKPQCSVNFEDQVAFLHRLPARFSCMCWHLFNAVHPSSCCVVVIKKG